MGTVLKDVKCTMFNTCVTKMKIEIKNPVIKKNKNADLVAESNAHATATQAANWATYKKFYKYS